MYVHRRALTRLTKISSSELSLVCRSLMVMPCSLRLLRERRDSGTLALRVKRVDELGAVVAQLEVSVGERRGNALQRLSQLQGELLAAELLHQHGLVLGEDDFAFVDDADPVRHLLRFLDVVRREDDGHAAFAQSADHLPHGSAQLHVHPGRGLVEKQDERLVRERLGDHHPALHAAGQRHDPRIALLPQRQVAEHLFQVGGIRGLAEQAAAELDGVPDALEGIGRQLLRHEPDPGSRRAVVANDVVSVRQDGSLRRVDDPADDADEGRLARAIGSQQREDLALADLQVDVLQRLEARSVGLGEIGNADDRLHELLYVTMSRSGTGVRPLPGALP